MYDPARLVIEMHLVLVSAFLGSSLHGDALECSLKLVHLLVGAILGIPGPILEWFFELSKIRFLQRLLGLGCRLSFLC